MSKFVFPSFLEPRKGMLWYTEGPLYILYYRLATEQVDIVTCSMREPYFVSESKYYVFICGLRRPLSLLHIQTHTQKAMLITKSSGHKCS